jgi:hypothetical protein
MYYCICHERYEYVPFTWRKRYSILQLKLRFSLKKMWSHVISQLQSINVIRYMYAWHIVESVVKQFEMSDHHWYFVTAILHVITFFSTKIVVLVAILNNASFKWMARIHIFRDKYSNTCIHRSWWICVQ